MKNESSSEKSNQEKLGSYSVNIDYSGEIGVSQNKNNDQTDKNDQNMSKASK